MSEENVNNSLQFEKIIIKLLFSRERIRDKVMPYLNKELFVGLHVKNLIQRIIDFNEEFKTFPKPHDLFLSLKDKEKELFKEIGAIDLSKYNEEHLLKQVEKYFKNQKIFNIFQEYTERWAKDNSSELDVQKLADANAFTFDECAAIDVMEEDGDEFFKYLHEEQKRVATGLKQFDYMMNGGFLKKTTTLFLGGTNKGKTLIKVALGKCCLYQGQNVLFIPLEGTKEQIKSRAIYNFFDASEEELKKLNLGELKDLFSKTKQILKGRFFIAEYGEHIFNANRLKLLLKELKEKKKFVPDIVFIDYLGLAAPNVIYKENGNPAYVLKRASEEFNAVWKEYDIAGVSSMQFNRQGYNSSDPDMDDISESFGTLFTAATIILIIQTDEMHKENRYAYKKVKARDPHKGFVGHLCVDYNKQKIFELDSNMKTEQEKKQVKEAMKSEEDNIQKMLNKIDENRLKKNIEFE